MIGAFLLVVIGFAIAIISVMSLSNPSFRVAIPGIRIVDVRPRHCRDKIRMARGSAGRLTETRASGAFPGTFGIAPISYAFLPLRRSPYRKYVENDDVHACC